MEIINLNGQLVTDSRDVAEMVGRQHNELLKTVRGYIEFLGQGDFAQSDFFIQHSYKNSQNKEMPCYLLTRKGCDMVANKMTGEKGVLFTAAYVTRFEEMEEHLKQKQPQFSSLEVALQAALQHEQAIKEIKTDVDYLKGSMRIDALQQLEIQRSAKQSIAHALGGKDSVAYREISKRVFPAFWNEFKRYFEVPRYPDLPKVKYDEALRFIKLWRPSTSLQMEIDGCNSQMTFE